MSGNELINKFLKGEVDLMLPFVLNHSEVSYQCDQILRLLPAKRLVVAARSKQQYCVIKLFAPNQKGQRELEREQQGHALARAAGVNVADIAFSSEDLAGCFAIAYDFIENSEEISLNNVDKNQDHVVKMLELMAKLHNFGVYQEDIHLDNILLADNELYLIDLASVMKDKPSGGVSVDISLDNVALMVAQFSLSEQTIFMQYIEHYYQARSWLFDSHARNEFNTRLDQIWQKRKKQYLSKGFRSCTMTNYRRSLSQESAFQAKFFRQSDVDLAQDIEDLISQGEVIKAGNSATVVKVMIAGKMRVIKRYNMKGFSHFLRRCWRPSRAAISWQNANLLNFIGLPTPTPLGFIENRVFGLRHTAYFICDYEPAQELLSVYQQRQPTADELSQIKTIFDVLEQAQISHGDLKASNLLLDSEGKILIIDLDAIQEHRCSGNFQQAFNKDKARFIANWHDAELRSLFTKLLN